MNENIEKNLIDIRSITKEIKNLTENLNQQKKETLDAIIECDAFNEARQNALDNIGISNEAVLQEISFIKDAVSTFGFDLLSEDVKSDKAYASIILNEYKYFDYWVGNPQMKEVKLSVETVTILKSRIYDLDFPARIINALGALDINYVFQLLQTAPSELRKCMNFGKISMKLINDFLFSKKLHFGIYIRFDERNKEYRTLV